MSNKETKNPQRNPVTVRFTNDELKLIDWYADRVGCDRSNSPRQIIAAFFTANAELYRVFQEETAE
jgi:hypothetical protein